MTSFNKIALPAWISYHTYFFGKPESRTYIENTKKHTYIQLDGISSDLWKLICDKVGDNQILSFAKENAIEDQLDDFISVLMEQELLIAASENTSEASCDPLPSSQELADEETAFIEEMKSWLFANNFMFSLFFELTYKCNLKCIHCYNPKHMNAVEIDFDLAKKAIDDAYELGCFRITFSGGEATMHSRFIDLVKYARQKHISVEIFTNGQALASNESLYECTKSLYPYRICVSLYSTDGDVHEKVTDVKGSFEKTYSLIGKMRRDNINVQIKNFLLNTNCMDCIKVKKYAETIGATSIADISLIPTIEGDKKTMQFMLSEDELFALYTDEKSPLRINDNFKPLEIEKIKNGAPCFGGFSGLCISPSAEAVVCVSMQIGRAHV